VYNWRITPDTFDLTSTSVLGSMVPDATAFSITVPVVTSTLAATGPDGSAGRGNIATLTAPTTPMTTIVPRMTFVRRFIMNSATVPWLERPPSDSIRGISEGAKRGGHRKLRANRRDVNELRGYPLQCFGERGARACDVHMPRNLAKPVAVE
jgi:hypothetical protein